MVAPRALILTIVMALAACASPATLAPSPPGSTTSPAPSPSGPGVALPETSPVVDVDLAAALRIAPPFELVPANSADFDALSGQIQGLPFDLAKSAGASYAPSDFPIGFQYIRHDVTSVGVVVRVGMPAEVAPQPGLIESIAEAAAAEANGDLAYETVRGIKVGVVIGPIASALAIVDGHLVFVQTGLPAFDPKDLIAAVIEASTR